MRDARAWAESKGSDMTNPPNRTRNPRSLMRVWPSLIALGAGLPFVATDALAQIALPTGPANQTNIASINTTTTTNPNDTMTVAVNNQRAFVSWTTFDVGSGYSFIVNTSALGALAPSSILVNRVTGPDATSMINGAINLPSMINGAVNSVGHVWILNGAGVIFGGGAQINVGGLLASSATTLKSGATTFTTAAQQAEGIMDRTLALTGTPVSFSGGDAGALIRWAGANLTAGQTIVLAGPNVEFNTSGGSTGGAVALVGASSFSVQFDEEMTPALVLSGLSIGTGVDTIAGGTGVKVGAGATVSGNRVILAAARTTPSAAAASLINVDGSLIASGAFADGAGIVLYSTTPNRTVLNGGATQLNAVTTVQGSDIVVSGDLQSTAGVRISSVNDATLAAGANLNSGFVAAGASRDVSVQRNVTGASGVSITAGHDANFGDIGVTAGNGVLLASLSVVAISGDVNGGLAAFSSVGGSNAAFVSAGDDVSLESLRSAHLFTVKAGGDITVGTLSGGGGAGTPSSLISTGGQVRAAAGNGGDQVLSELTLRGLDVFFDGGTVMQGLTLDATAGQANILGETSARSLLMTAGGPATIDTGSVENGVTVTNGDADISAGAGLRIASNINATAGGLSASGSSVSINSGVTLSSSMDLSVEATLTTVSADGAMLNSDAGVTVEAVTDVQVGTITSGTTTTVTGTSGDVDLTMINAGTTANISGSNATVGTLNAGAGASMVTANGTMANGQASAGAGSGVGQGVAGSLTVSGRNGATFTGGKVSGALTVTGDSTPDGTGVGAITGASTVTGNLQLTGATTNVQGGTVEVHGDAAIIAATGTASFGALGSVLSRGDLEVTGQTGVDAGMNAITLQANRDGSGATDFLQVKANTGAISAANATFSTGGGLGAQSAVNIFANGAGGSVNVATSSGSANLDAQAIGNVTVGAFDFLGDVYVTAGGSASAGGEAGVGSFGGDVRIIAGSGAAFTGTGAGTVATLLVRTTNGTASVSGATTAVGGGDDPVDGPINDVVVRSMNGDVGITGNIVNSGGAIDIDAATGVNATGQTLDAGPTHAVTVNTTGGAATVGTVNAGATSNVTSSGGAASTGAVTGIGNGVTGGLTVSGANGATFTGGTVTGNLTVTGDSDNSGAGQGAITGVTTAGGIGISGASATAGTSGVLIGANASADNAVAISGRTTGMATSAVSVGLSVTVRADRNDVVGANGALSVTAATGDIETQGATLTAGVGDGVTVLASAGKAFVGIVNAGATSSIKAGGGSASVTSANVTGMGSNLTVMGTNGATFGGGTVADGALSVQGGVGLASITGVTTADSVTVSGATASIGATTTADNGDVQVFATSGTGATSVNIAQNVSASNGVLVNSTNGGITVASGRTVASNTDGVGVGNLVASANGASGAIAAAGATLTAGAGSTVQATSSGAANVGTVNAGTMGTVVSSGATATAGAGTVGASMTVQGATGATFTGSTGPGATDVGGLLQVSGGTGTAQITGATTAASVVVTGGVAQINGGTTATGGDATVTATSGAATIAALLSATGSTQVTGQTGVNVTGAQQVIADSDDTAGGAEFLNVTATTGDVTATGATFGAGAESAVTVLAANNATVKFVDAGATSTVTATAGAASAGSPSSTVIEDFTVSGSNGATFTGGTVTGALSVLGNAGQAAITNATGNSLVGSASVVGDSVSVSGQTTANAGGISLESTGGDITVSAPLSATGAIDMLSAGSIFLSSTSTSDSEGTGGEDITIEAAAAVDGATATLITGGTPGMRGGDISVIGATLVTIGNVSARDVSLEATAGAATVGAAGGGNVGSLIVERDLSVTGSTGATFSGGVIARDLTVTSSGGAATIDTATATIGRNAVLSGQTVVFDRSLLAAGSVNATGANGVSVTAGRTVGANTDGLGAEALNVTATAGNITAPGGFSTGAGSAMTLLASAGAVNAGLVNGGGLTNVTGATDASIGALDAAGDTTVTATSGTASVTTANLTNGADLTINGGTSASLGGPSTITGDLAVRSAGDASVDQATVTGALVAEGATPGAFATSATISNSSGASVTARGATAVISDSSATGLLSASGAVVILSNVSGDMVQATLGALTLDGVIAGNTIDLSGTSASFVGADSSSGGDITINTQSLNLGTDISAANNIVINTTTGLTIGSGVTVQSNSDGLAGGTLGLSSNGAIQASGSNLYGGTAGARTDVTVTAGNGVAIGSVRGANVTLDNNGASALVATGLSAVDASGAATFTGPFASTGDFTVAGATTSVEDVAANGAISLSGTNGVTINGVVRSNANGDANLESLTVLSSAGAVNASGALISGTATGNRGDVSVTGATIGNLAMVTARDFSLAATAGTAEISATGGGVDVNTLSAERNITLAGSTGATFHGGAVVNDLSVSSSGGAATFGTAATTVGGATSVNGQTAVFNQSLTGNGAVNVNGANGVTVASGQTVLANADGAGGQALTVMSGGPVQASGATLAAGTNTSRSNVDVTGGGLAVGTARGATVSLANTGGAALTATGATTVDATVLASLSGAHGSAGTYTIVAPALSLGSGTVQSGTGIVVQSRSTTNQNAGRNMALGDITGAQSPRNDLSNAMTLSAATINNLRAPTVTFQTGPSSAAGGNITLGNLTVDSAAIPSIVLLPGTGARVEIVGAVQRTGIAATNLSVGAFTGTTATDWIADTTIVTGSIGVTTQAANAAGSPTIASFGRVQLSASRMIAIGPATEDGVPLEAFLNGLALDYDLSQLAGPTIDSGHVFVAAADLDLSSAGRILQRNTGFTGEDGRGLLLGQLEVRGLGALEPTQISLFGIVDRFNTVTAPFGVAWTMADGRDAALAGGSVQPILNGGLTPHTVYRINGCEFGSAASCIITVNLDMGVRPEQVVPDLASLQPDELDELEDDAVTNLGNDSLIIRGR